MTMTFTKTSIFTEQQIAQWIREEHPKFIQFITLYYEWLESQGNPIDVSRKLLDYQDVDITPDLFFEFLRNEFLADVPKKIVTDKRLLLKNISDFFRSRGSEKSFELLFRILFNEEIEFYYPATDILRASDGKWVVEKLITLTPISGVGSQLFRYLGKDVVGATSGARARVERVVSFFSQGVQVFQMYLSNVFGVFSNEILYSLNQEPIGNINSYVVFPGYWQGTDGFLSSNKYIQDSYYYQEYSYELRTGQPVNKYKDIVDKLVHPSGMLMFGQIYINRQIIVPIQQVSRDKVSLEIEFTNESGLVKEVGTGLDYDDFTDLLEALYEFSISFFATKGRETTVIKNRPGVVNLYDGSLTQIQGYTLGELQNVTPGDAMSDRVILAPQGNHPNLSVGTFVGQNIAFQSALNTNEFLAIDRLKAISSNVCVTTAYPWHGTRALNNDKVALATYNIVEND